jgi:hypothetical protein
MAIHHKLLTGIAEKAFDAWAAAPAGVEAITELSQTIPTMESVMALGADKAARKRLWKAAEDAVQDTALGILIEGHAAAYPTYPGIVAGLLSPHSVMPDSGGSFLPDVYALPRYLVKEYALRKFAAQRTAGPVEKIADLLDVEAFLAAWIDHFDAEYNDGLRLRKEPAYLGKEPVVSAPNWSVYGFEADYEWKAGLPLGHYFLAHDTLKPGQKHGSKDRKEAESNVVKLETVLAGYDLNQRAAMVAALEERLKADPEPGLGASLSFQRL